MAKGVKNSGKEARNSFKEVPCIIGIDQSYTRTGISIAVNGKLKKVTSITFVKSHIKTKSAKRMEVQRVLRKAIESCLKYFTPDEIVVLAERVRTYTASNELRPIVIKAQSAMIAYIVDTAYLYGIKVFSVDTRHWKTRVLGTAQPSVEAFEGVKNPQKILAVKKIISLGFEEDIRLVNNHGTVTYNDDAADSACIALYGFSGRPYQLQLEM